jgi:hypothetical protein
MTDPNSPGPARVAAGRVGALMTSVMDRMFGSPKASLELEVTNTPAELSDDDLEASLSALLEKLRGEKP